MAMREPTSLRSTSDTPGPDAPFRFSRDTDRTPALRRDGNSARPLARELGVEQREAFSCPLGRPRWDVARHPCHTSARTPFGQGRVWLVRRIVWWIVLLLAVAGLAGCGGSGAPRAGLTVSPAVALWDQPRTIVVSHLHPGEVVTLRARTVLPDGMWGASAVFKADRTGTVDVARQPPLSGSYSGTSPMGLRWSETLLKSHAGPLNGQATTKFTATVEKTVAIREHDSS